MKLATRAVHAGERQRKRNFIPVSTPIYSSATFIYDSIEQIDRVAGGEPGYMYGRYHNPTWTALEESVATLEEAETAVAFSTGMAAVHAAVLLAGVRAGDRVLCSQDVYGATTGLLLNVFAPLGVEVRFANFGKADEFEAALAESKPRLVIVETLSNPLLRVVDLRSLSDRVHRVGAKLLVDSTFATPVLCRPFSLGADYVVHSATKYLAGHGDVLGGIVLAREADRPALELIRKLVGGVLGPFEAWLVLRGVKTLPLRIERQCSNARHIAKFLSESAAVERVYYPGLRSHPDHDTAARQFSRSNGTEPLFGGIVSFEIKGAGKQEVFRFINSLKICLPGTSLGDVQSLVLYPLISSHRDISPKQRERAGIRENLVRLSAGIEDADDIIADLEQALSGIADVAEEGSAVPGTASSSVR